jgi:hypothetical protein
MNPTFRPPDRMPQRDRGNDVTVLLKFLRPAALRLFPLVP